MQSKNACNTTCALYNLRILGLFGWVSKFSESKLGYAKTWTMSKFIRKNLRKNLKIVVLG